jgi:cysteinyl-tRNA synthetase
MDLAATHHTNEIAQSQACNHTAPVRYWLHTNMLTVNGVRMSKSAGNGFLPDELFSGSHPLLEKGYAPMAVRFFMLQTHYRSTLDFSNEALQASEKGFARLAAGIKTLKNLKTSSTSTSNIKELEQKCYEAMNDDFNSPILLAILFEGVRIINSVNDGKETISSEDLVLLKKMMHHFVFDVLGLKTEYDAEGDGKFLEGVMKLILSIREQAKAQKDFATSDKIRNDLIKQHIIINDTKDGTTWNIEK